MKKSTAYVQPGLLPLLFKAGGQAPYDIQRTLGVSALTLREMQDGTSQALANNPGRLARLSKVSSYSNEQIQEMVRKLQANPPAHSYATGSLVTHPYRGDGEVEGCNQDGSLQVRFKEKDRFVANVDPICLRQREGEYLDLNHLISDLRAGANVNDPAKSFTLGPRRALPEKAAQLLAERRAVAAAKAAAEQPAEAQAPESTAQEAPSVSVTASTPAPMAIDAGSAREGNSPQIPKYVFRNLLHQSAYTRQEIQARIGRSKAAFYAYVGGINTLPVSAIPAVVWAFGYNSTAAYLVEQAIAKGLDELPDLSAHAMAPDQAPISAGQLFPGLMNRTKHSDAPASANLIKVAREKFYTPSVSDSSDTGARKKDATPVPNDRSSVKSAVQDDAASRGAEAPVGANPKDEVRDPAKVISMGDFRGVRLVAGNGPSVQDDPEDEECMCPQCNPEGAGSPFGGLMGMLLPAGQHLTSARDGAFTFGMDPMEQGGDFLSQLRIFSELTRLFEPEAIAQKFGDRDREAAMEIVAFLGGVMGEVEAPAMEQIQLIMDAERDASRMKKKARKAERKQMRRENKQLKAEGKRQRQEISQLKASLSALLGKM